MIVEYLEFITKKASFELKARLTGIELNKLYPIRYPLVGVSKRVSPMKIEFQKQYVSLKTEEISYGEIKESDMIFESRYLFLPNDDLIKEVTQERKEHEEKLMNEFQDLKKAIEETEQQQDLLNLTKLLEKYPNFKP